jgi:hypothetical protein
MSATNAWFLGKLNRQIRVVGRRPDAGRIGSSTGFIVHDQAAFCAPALTNGG